MLQLMADAQRAAGSKQRLFDAQVRTALMPAEWLPRCRW
jgi:hypothetical protein